MNRSIDWKIHFDYPAARDPFREYGYWAAEKREHSSIDWAAPTETITDNDANGISFLMIIPGLMIVPYVKMGKRRKNLIK